VNEAPSAPAEAFVPAGPTLRGAIATALRDAYYHSWRLLPANVVWAVATIAVLVANLVTPLALVLLPALALPTAGLFRVTTRIVRGEAVSFWDAVDAWRVDVRVTLAVGAAFAAAALVLSANVVLGLGGSSPLGWALATLAAWGVIAQWLLAWTLWPILVDPLRADVPARDRARLAALLALAHPFRIGALGLLLGAFLVASTVAIVALVTISMALAALVASRYVLPAADRLEAQLAARTPVPAPGSTAPTASGTPDAAIGDRP
jgi:hypothetical protein